MLPRSLDADEFHGCVVQNVAGNRTGHCRSRDCGGQRNPETGMGFILKIVKKEVVDRIPGIGFVRRVASNRLQSLMRRGNIYGQLSSLVWEKAPTSRRI
jgi:hypothetical protein